MTSSFIDQFYLAVQEAQASNRLPTEWAVSPWGRAEILKNADMGHIGYSSDPIRPNKLFGVGVRTRVDFEKTRVALMAGEDVVTEFDIHTREAGSD